MHNTLLFNNVMFCKSDISNILTLHTVLILNITGGKEYKAASCLQRLFIFIHLNVGS